MSVNWRDLPALPPEERPEIRDDWIPSQTFLRTMDNCDRAAYLYLKHRGGGSSHPLNRGSLFHMVAERLLGEMAAHDEPQATPEQGREMVAEVMAENPEMQIPMQERDALRYMVDHFCRGFYCPGTIIGIETTFTLEIGGFRVLARADLVEDLGGGVCQITDFKTAWPPDSEAFTRQAYDREGKPRWAGNYQLNMLAVLAHYGLADDGMKLGDFDRYRLVLGFPRELKPEGIVRRYIDVEPLQLDAYREDLELQLRRLAEVNIGEGKWQATPGNHCRECPCQYECPLPPLLRPESQHADLDAIEDLEKAAVASNFMAARAQNLKARVKKAAERMEDADPAALLLPSGDRGVRIGKDLAFVFVPTEKETIRDKAQFRQQVEDAARGVGPEPEWDRLYKRSEGVAFEKRKVAP